MEKVIVITGAGGVLCSGFAEFLAGKGNKVALLDLNEEAAKRVADKITAAGGNAKAYKCNVLDKANIEEAHGKVLKDLGKCDILINGAGGNNPKCTTAHEEYEKGDEQASDFLTFFNIDEKGFDFVFDLNIKGVLLPSQVFMADMIGRKGCSVLNISSMNAYQNTRVLCGKGGGYKLYGMACGAFCKGEYTGKRHSSGIFCYKPEPRAAV